MKVQKNRDYAVFIMKSILFRTAFLEFKIYKVNSALKHGPMTQ